MCFCKCHASFHEENTMFEKTNKSKNKNHTTLELCLMEYSKIFHLFHQQQHKPKLLKCWWSVEVLDSVHSVQPVVVVSLSGNPTASSVEHLCTVGVRVSGTHGCVMAVP